MTSKQVFIDSSWFKAIADDKDEFSEMAEGIFKKFREAKVSLITTNFILDETFTLIRSKVSLKRALDFQKLLLDMRDVLKIVRISEKDESKAWGWFPKNWSKLSFTDCTSFAVMERLGLKEVATFDEHFTQAGFAVVR